MQLTARARALLDQYLVEVWRAQAADPGVDAEAVAAGIEEHVESELAALGLDRATGEDVAAVLERLGPPSGWGGPGTEEARQPTASPPRSDLATRTIRIGAVGLAILGLTLVLAGVWGAAGWGLVLVAAVLARVSEGEPDRLSVVMSESSGARDPLARLNTVLWWSAVLGGATALLLGPGALVWGQAQTGGALEPVLAERVGNAIRPRGPGYRGPGYWRAVAWLVGGVTGGWWLAVSAVLAVARAGLRRVLGTAAVLLPHRAPGALAVAGFILLIVSVIGALLS